jgi:phage terminase large subunit
MFKRTTAVNKILSLTKRKKVIQGGTSASKTYSILAILIDKACKNPKLEISVVSETIPHLRRGAIKDFKKIMQGTNRWIDSHWNSTLLTYSFGNGSFIEFFSTDQEDRLRGARRNILYVNEANNISFEAYYQLAIRTSSDIYIDFNPSESFWAHNEVLNESDAELLILTYRDNEALPDNVVGDLNQAKEKAKTSAYWANWCRVYIDGQIGHLQGAVFDNWDQVPEIPKDATFISYGMDFGFTNDPTALLGVWKQNGQLYVKELIYQTRLTNQDIANKLTELKITRQQLIVADSAEPKSIEELSRHGFQVQGAMKGADSIRASIANLQQYKINVTSDSLNLIKELRSYKWEVTKSGETINKPIDFQNHAIDALRYVALNKLSNTSYTKIVIA